MIYKKASSGTTGVVVRWAELWRLCAGLSAVHQFLFLHFSIQRTVSFIGWGGYAALLTAIKHRWSTLSCCQNLWNCRKQWHRTEQNVFLNEQFMRWGDSFFVNYLTVFFRAYAGCFVPWSGSITSASSYIFTTELSLSSSSPFSAASPTLLALVPPVQSFINI